MTNWSEDIVSAPTHVLRGIVRDLEDVGDLLHYYAKGWRRDRLREVRAVLRQREWAREKWNEGSD